MAIPDLEREGPRQTIPWELEEKIMRLTELEYMFWVGEDFVSAEDKIIKPQQASHLILNFKPENLPLPLLQLKLIVEAVGMELDLFTSIRSRGTQAGFIFTHSSEEEIVSVVPGESAELKMGVRVLGGRPIGIREGQRIACFYSPMRLTSFDGQEILSEKHWRPGGFEILGNYNQDWFFVDKNSQPLEHQQYAEAVALGLPLKPELFYIPEGEEPIYIFDENIPDSRSFLDDQLLQPIPPEARPEFLVGETKAGMRLKTFFDGLSYSHLIFNGVLGRDVWSRKRGIVVSEQLQSTLIRGDQTEDWPIRVELWPYEPNLHLYPEDLYVTLKIYRSWRDSFLDRFPYSKD